MVITTDCTVDERVSGTGCFIVQRSGRYAWAVHERRILDARRQNGRSIRSIVKRGAQVRVAARPVDRVHIVQYLKYLRNVTSARSHNVRLCHRSHMIHFPI